ncbi:MAG: LPXTG cell wall anchor domain-containing protein [Acidimicrobiales bacterium]
MVTAVKVEAQRSRLAITGSDETGLAVIGGGLLLAGAAVLVVRRRAGAHAA